MQIRSGKKEDVPALMRLIKELAVFENAGDEVEIGEGDLLHDGFGQDSLFSFLLAENNEGECMGIALYYNRYSTWKGKSLYLEDLVVSEQFRRKGVGKALFDELLKIAKLAGVRRFHWQVLDWNESAIEFYKKYEVEMEDDWLNCSMRLK